MTLTRFHLYNSTLKWTLHMLANWLTEIAYAGQVIDRDHNYRTEICNDPIGLVVLAAYEYLLKRWKITKRKTQCMLPESNNEISLISKSCRTWELAHMMTTFSALHLWKMMLWTMFWSTQNIVSSKIAKMFNFPIVHPFALCPTPTSIRVCLLAMTEPK